MTHDSFGRAAARGGALDGTSGDDEDASKASTSGVGRESGIALKSYCPVTCGLRKRESIVAWVE